MNADGSAQNNLTQLVDEEAGSSWQTVPSADLALSLVGNADEAKPQKPFTYTVRVENIGPSNAAGVVVTNNLPAEPRFVSASSSRGSCVDAARRLDGDGDLRPRLRAAAAVRDRRDRDQDRRAAAILDHEHRQRGDRHARPIHGEQRGGDHDAREVRTE